MRKLFFFILFIQFVLTGNAQEDWDWWNEQHGWTKDSPGWRNYLVISPGFLGPNALPVPEVKRGFLSSKTEFEITGSAHFHSGDPTQDVSGKVYVPFANGKIAVEAYGVLLEHFAYTDEIRNERFSRNKEGQGWAIGDLYFTTLIQLIKNRKFPNTLLRVALKTASGSDFDGARYADAPGYFFDLSFSKDFGSNENLVFRPFGMAGFYSWQTNDELNLQNDALLYGLGFDFIKNNWTTTASWSGYHGYKDNGDRPMQLNFDLRKDYNKKAFRLQYQHGLHDWMYRTVRFSFIWKLNGIN